MYSITAGRQRGRGGRGDPNGSETSLWSPRFRLRALQTRRLRRSAELPLMKVLTRELECFEYKVTADRNETFAVGREGENDDIVLAAALAIFHAEKIGVPDPNYVPPPITPLLPAHYGRPHEPSYYGTPR